MTTQAKAREQEGTPHIPQPQEIISLMREGVDQFNLDDLLEAEELIGEAISNFLNGIDPGKAQNIAYSLKEKADKLWAHQLDRMLLESAQRNS